jgi:sodium transport system ATP-binding protein
MSEAQRLCDRIAIMHRGHILAEGSLAELQSRHGEHDLEELFFRLISEHDSSSKFQVSGFRLAESTP